MNTDAGALSSGVQWWAWRSLPPSRVRQQGILGNLRAAGVTAMSLSDTLPGGLTACGRPGLTAPGNAASAAWGASVSAVISLAIGARL